MIGKFLIKCSFSILVITIFSVSSALSQIDTTDLNTILNELKKVLYNDQDRAIELSDQVILLAKKGRHSSYLAQGHRFKGIAYDILGKYEAGISEYDQAEYFANKANDSALIGKLLIGKGIIHHRLENYQLALDYYLKAMEILQKVGNEPGEIGAANNIGAVYTELDLFEESRAIYRAYLKKALILQDSVRIASLYNNLATNFFKTNEYDSSRFFIKKALDVNLLTNNLYSISTSYQTLGALYNENNQFDSAIFFFNKSLNIAGNSSNPLKIAEAKLAIAGVLIRQQKFELVEQVLDTVYHISKEFPDNHEISNKYYLFNAFAYDSLDNHFKASNYYSEALKNKETMQKNSARQKLLSINLEKQSKEYQLKLSRSETNQAHLISENQRQKAWLIIGSVFLISILIITFTLYKAWKLRIKYNSVLRLRNTELESDIKSTDRMIRVLAHDFRSPLASLKMAFDHISDSRMTEEERLEISKQAKRHLNHTLQKIDQLLFWLTREKKQLKPKIVDIEKAINSALEIHQPEILDKNIGIKREKLNESSIVFDELNFQVMSRNIIHNSLKFLPLNGEIKICYTEKESNQELRFTDNGAGIEPVLLEHINAQRFDKVRPSSKDSTGLGIELVFEIVEQNGGKVRYESEIGKGTTVIVEIPKQN